MPSTSLAWIQRQRCSSGSLASMFCLTLYELHLAQSIALLQPGACSPYGCKASLLNPCILCQFKCPCYIQCAVLPEPSERRAGIPLIWPTAQRQAAAILRLCCAWQPLRRAAHQPVGGFSSTCRCFVRALLPFTVCLGARVPARDAERWSG